MHAGPEMSFNQASNIAPVVNHQSATSMYSVRAGADGGMSNSFHNKDENSRPSFE